jgi:hypothetical protein
VIRQAISCDICGRDKQQTNHWFVVCEHATELRVSGWSSQARMSTKAKHLCGQTCLHKLIDEYMARTLTARVASSVDENIVIEERVERLISAPLRADAVRVDAVRADASYTSAAAHAASVRLTAPAIIPIDEFESSARLVTPTEATAELASVRPAAHKLAREAAVEDEIESSARLIDPAAPIPEEALQPVAAVSKRIDDKRESTVRVIMPILELHDEKVIPSRPGYNPRTWRGDAWKREQEREKHARTGSRRRSLV